MPRFLSHRADVSPQAVLARLAAETPPDAAFDVYGRGELVAELERETAALLGKEVAVFSLSGKAAQLSILRVHADRRGPRLVAVHPRSHIVEDENDTIGALYGLGVARTGSLFRVTTVADLDAVREPLAAVAIELPLRRIGYQVPAWDDLVALTERARELGAAVHLDGARLWEVQPYYDRPHAEIAALFDTVYVSYYKGLGAPAGGALVGSADDIEAARVWITRAGAIAYQMYPMTIAALAGLRAEVPRMDAYYVRAVELADALASVEGLTLVPDPPQCNAFQVHLHGEREALLRASEEIAAERDLTCIRWLSPTQYPGVQMLELTVGANTLAIDVAEARDTFAAILARANA